ncbi:MAG: hypothetical protein Q4E67_04510 [Planctomycetia bacterium]|nr:hypothetical protein [Planctomycetia bacterium]
MKKNHPLLLLLFFLFGLFPVVGLLIWSGVRHTEGYVLYVQWQAEKVLGVPVKIGKIEHPRPNRIRWRDVSLSNGQIQIPQVEIWNRTLKKEGKSFRQYHYTLPELTLETVCLETLWNLHQNVLTRPEGWKGAECFLEVEDAVHVKTMPPLEIQDAHLQISQGKFGPQTEITFLLPDEGKFPVTLMLQKVTQGTSQVMVATLQTPSAGIRTSHLFSLFPMLQQMGNDSRFSGKIVIQQSFRGWSGLFSGTFQNINLAALRGRDGSITGWGTLTLESARFDGGLLTQAKGMFEASGGAIRRHFLDQIILATQLSTRGIPLDMADPIPFQEMRFSFLVQNSRVELLGGCASHGPGVFLAGRNGPILCEPTHPRNPLRASVFFGALMEK